MEGKKRAAGSRDGRDKGQKRRGQAWWEAEHRDYGRDQSRLFPHSGRPNSLDVGKESMLSFLLISCPEHVGSFNKGKVLAAP